MEIKDFSGIERTIKEIITSAKETTNKFSAMTAETLLFEGKFGNLGTKWDDCKQPYDLGEQIQQSMTILSIQNYPLQKKRNGKVNWMLYWRI